VVNKRSSISRVVGEICLDQGGGGGGGRITKGGELRREKIYKRIQRAGVGDKKEKKKVKEMGCLLACLHLVAPKPRERRNCAHQRAGGRGRREDILHAR